MKSLSKILIALILFSGYTGTGQTTSQALSKFNTEGFQKSQVMDLISELSDVYGPRLLGTDQYYTAAEWAKQKLESYGVDRVYFEKFCDDVWAGR